MTEEAQKTVSYGFADVAPDEKTARVGSVFRRVARRYDLMNDILSFGSHRLWKSMFVDLVDPRAGEEILDVAGGTGDIARRLKRRGAQVMVADINYAMLQEGRERLGQGGQDGLSWVQANAEQLGFTDASFNAYTIAFGIRNVTYIDRALSEAHRVLKYGGRFFCLEFSRVSWPLLRSLHERYTLDILPHIGAAVAGDAEAYRYLGQSLHRFDSPDVLSERLKAAGFDLVTHRLWFGGIVAVHCGWKV